jgi:hypothetical protein
LPSLRRRRCRWSRGSRRKSRRLSHPQGRQGRTNAKEAGQKRGKGGRRAGQCAVPSHGPSQTSPPHSNPELSLLCTQIENQDILLPRLVPFIQPVGDGSRGRLVDDPFHF